MGKTQFLLVFIVLMAVNVIPAKAYDFTYGGIKYKTLTDSTCAVVNYYISGDVVIPEKVEDDYNYNKKEYRVTEILAFSGCTSLTSVETPNSVTRIEYGAFKECTSLTSVKIPNSVTTIEYGAFSECTSLTNVDIPNSVKKIEEYATPLNLTT